MSGKGFLWLLLAAYGGSTHDGVGSGHAPMASGLSERDRARRKKRNRTSRASRRRNRGGR